MTEPEGHVLPTDLPYRRRIELRPSEGVVEAANVPFSNPISISGTGREVVGGIVGASFSWIVNMNQVFVCERGNSIQTGFPNGLRTKIAGGARFGRCEHLDD